MAEENQRLQSVSPRKTKIGLSGTDRPQDGLQNNSAEKIRQALGKRAGKSLGPVELLK